MCKTVSIQLNMKNFNYTLIASDQKFISMPKHQSALCSALRRSGVIPLKLKVLSSSNSMVQHRG